MRTREQTCPLGQAEGWNPHQNTLSCGLNPPPMIRIEMHPLGQNGQPLLTEMSIIGFYENLAANPFGDFDFILIHGPTPEHPCPRAQLSDLR